MWSLRIYINIEGGGILVGTCENAGGSSRGALLGLLSEGRLLSKVWHVSLSWFDNDSDLGNLEAFKFSGQ